MIFTALPLSSMKLTQPFGVNYGPTPDFYTKIGLRAHNGWDLSALGGTPVYAVIDGIAYCDQKNPSTGYGNNLRIRSKELGLEIIYGHLQEFKVSDGQAVKAGDIVALSDNTGYSTGPHLHFGIKPIVWHIDGSGPYPVLPANGYSGCIDPAAFFPSDVFDLPVDKCYGLTPRTLGVPSEFDFLKTMTNFWFTQKRLMTRREYNAFRFGFWDLRTVLDTSMTDVWQQMTKPEAEKRGIVK